MASKDLIADKVAYIVIHCSATKPDMDIGLEEIDRWHRKREFLKIGYHAVIRRDGRVEWGRGNKEVGAHAYGFNSKSVGICLVGGVDESLRPENTFNELQFEALKYLIKYYQQFYPKAAILGHRDLPKVTKACPSFDVSSWLKDNDIS